MFWKEGHFEYRTLRAHPAGSPHRAFPLSLIIRHKTRQTLNLKYKLINGTRRLSHGETISQIRENYHYNKMVCIWKLVGVEPPYLSKGEGK